MMRTGKRTAAGVFAAACLLMLAAGTVMAGCGGEGEKEMAASVMRLIKTEGEVEVTDHEDGAVPLVENLSLYSGYGLATHPLSYGWISLDDAKLAKMDAVSEIEIQKSEGKLEIEVKSGGMFFNVTEPLAGDETMDIRSSSMVVGIRGTCGWVETEGEGALRVGLFKGEVECSIFDEEGSLLAEETITAGQTARMVKGAEGASITVSELGAGGLPGFVRQELRRDDSLAAGLAEASGIDVYAEFPAGLPLPLRCYQIAAMSQTPHDRIDYSYEEETGRIRCVSYEVSDAWKERTSWYMEVTYDARGRIEKQQTYGGDGVPGSRMIQVESGADYSVYEMTDRGGVLTDRITVYYDGQGRLLRSEYDGAVSEGKAGMYILYDYDGQGRLLRRIQVTESWSAVSQVYMYDEKEPMTESSFVMPRGVTWPDYGDPAWQEGRKGAVLPSGLRQREGSAEETL